MKYLDFERECLICGNPTGYMSEVDITVGVIKSTEPSICEDCFSSENEEIQQQIKEINRNYELFTDIPF